jgi:hypothetical protein
VRPSLPSRERSPCSRMMLEETHDEPESTPRQCVPWQAEFTLRASRARSRCSHLATPWAGPPHAVVQRVRTSRHVCAISRSRDFEHRQRGRQGGDRATSRSELVEQWRGFRAKQGRS